MPVNPEIGLLEGIMTTRTIRRYTDEPVTDEEIGICLRAAAQGPTAGNFQAARFLVVTDPEVRLKVAELYRAAYARYEPAMLAALSPARREDQSYQRILRSARHLATHLQDAPALVMFLMPAEIPVISDADGVIDAGSPLGSVFPAMQNFMLAARGLGIGTALTTGLKVEERRLLDLLGVPEHYSFVAMVSMGRPRGRFGVAPRRPAWELTHWNRYGDRRPPE